MNLSKDLSKNILVVILAGFALSLGIFLRFAPKNQAEKSVILPTANPDLSYEQDKTYTALPVRLRIPKINVDAAIDYVGLTAEWRVDVPKGPDNAAWFNLGPRPGELGSSIIDGHSGYKNGRAAVFDNLDKLQMGDKLYVEDSKGASIAFVVSGFHSYSPKAEAKEVFNSGDQKAHLNLITCTGAWNEEERTHSNRYVVFTDKE